MRLYSCVCLFVFTPFSPLTLPFSTPLLQSHDVNYSSIDPSIDRILPTHYSILHPPSSILHPLYSKKRFQKRKRAISHFAAKGRLEWRKFTRTERNERDETNENVFGEEDEEEDDEEGLRAILRYVQVQVQVRYVGRGSSGSCKYCMYCTIVRLNSLKGKGRKKEKRKEGRKEGREEGKKVEKIDGW